jgi:cytochrome c biogenesis protein CcdA
MTQTPVTRQITAVRTAVSVVARHPRSRTLAGAIMATIGVLVILSEVGLHIYSAITHTKYEIDHIVLLAGALLGFWGFYWIDGKSAAGAVAVIRGGRRSTDAPVVIGKSEEKP